MAEALTRIQSTAVDALKRWLDGPEDRKTENLRQVGGLFVDAREHFLANDGEPDWLGRSHAYRSWVRETMSLAGVPKDRVSGTLTSIRYHAGNALRDRLDDDKLADLGLLKTTPLERAQGRNTDKSRTYQILEGSRIEGGADMLEALGAIQRILRRIDLGSVPSLPADARQALEGAAEQVAAYAAGLAGAAGRRHVVVEPDAGVTFMMDEAREDAPPTPDAARSIAARHFAAAARTAVEGASFPVSGYLKSVALPSAEPFVMSALNALNMDDLARLAVRQILEHPSEFAQHAAESTPGTDEVARAHLEESFAQQVQAEADVVSKFRLPPATKPTSEHSFKPRPWKHE